MDAKNAFLYGKFDREIYMNHLVCFQSKDHPKHVCKLKKDTLRIKTKTKSFVWQDCQILYLRRISINTYRFQRICESQWRKDNYYISLCEWFDYNQWWWVRNSTNKWELVNSFSGERTWRTQEFSWVRGWPYTRRNICLSIKIFKKFVTKIWNAWLQAISNTNGNEHQDVCSWRKRHKWSNNVSKIGR